MFLLACVDYYWIWGSSEYSLASVVGLSMCCIASGEVLLLFAEMYTV